MDGALAYTINDVSQTDGNDYEVQIIPSYTVFTKGEALEDKQKLQMKTFSELVECLARIPPKITLYGLLFKYNYLGCLLLLMFSSGVRSKFQHVTRQTR